MISPDAVAADWIGKEASWKQFVEFVATLKGESCSFFNSSLLRAWSGATSPSPPPGPGHSVGDSTGGQVSNTHSAKGASDRNSGSSGNKGQKKQQKVSASSSVWLSEKRALLNSQSSREERWRRRS